MRQGETLAIENFKERLIAAASNKAPSTVEQYAANIQHEEGKWVALAKKLGLKLEELRL